MPPEKSAYALARYSRSPDSIRASIDWVRTHDSQKFLESFYFQYGHASIADLGHTVMCFEGVSELAATEIEERAAVGWAGEIVALSGFFAFRLRHAARVDRKPTRGRIALRARRCLSAYGKVNELAFAHLCERYPRPEEMKPESLSPQYRGPRFRRGALPAVLGRAHQCGAGHQHSHAGKADPALEGVRICGDARIGRRTGAGMRRPAGLRLGRAARRPSPWRPRWRGTPMRTSCLRFARGFDAVGAAEFAGRASEWSRGA